MKRWGVPVKTDETNPEELTAIWREESLHAVDVGGRGPRYCDHGLGGDGSGAACIPTLGVAPGTSTVRSGYRRSLVFDRKTQVLKSWNYEYW